MKRLFSVLCIFSFACKSPDKIPDNVIKIDTMKTIVWDMIEAGEVAQLQSGSDSSLYKKRLTEKYQQVFDLHAISKSVFYNSYAYYEKRPDKNKILMDSVTAYANRKRAESYIKAQ